jgi:hypothetical protein
MSTSEPRIVAVTDSTALVIGLTCLPTSWDVVCHPTTDAGFALRGSAEVLVLDLGSTAAGLEWIAGPSEPDGKPGNVPRWVVIGDTEPRGSVPANTLVLLRPYTLPQLSEAIHRLLSGETIEVTPEDDGTSASEEPLSAQLFGTVATGSVQEAAPSTPIPAVIEQADGFESGAAKAATPPAAPSPDTEDAPGAGTERLIDLTRIPEATSQAEEERQPRWFARRPRRTGAQEGQLRDRLAAALAATAELERLVEQVPMLRSLETFAAAIVADIVTQLDATTAGFWRTAEDGWELAAHHGLTAHESKLHVPLDHPLFSEVDASGGAILIDPVDALLSAVAGIGGAHTESFMAASIAAGPGRFGILAVGRDRPLKEADLDILVELASEAAPGVAVAEQLARIRALAKAPEPAPAGR